MMVQHAASVKGGLGKAHRFRCQILDSMVLDASAMLLMRHGHVDEPGGVVCAGIAFAEPEYRASVVNEM